MNTSENNQFISGTYNIGQANNMLKSLYKALISFHKIENLSTQVLFDKDNLEAISAIDRLKEELESINQTLQVARLIDKKIKVKSTIEVCYEE